MLAAVERLGRPNMTELWDEFPNLMPSEIHRVLRALARRGLVRASGDPQYVYVGGVRFRSAAFPAEFSDLIRIREALEQEGLAVEDTDEEDESVLVLLPLLDIESHLSRRKAPFLGALRRVVSRLEQAGTPAAIEVSPSIWRAAADGSCAIEVRLVPAEDEVSAEAGQG